MHDIAKIAKNLRHNDVVESKKVFDEAMKLYGDVELAVGIVYCTGHFAGSDFMRERWDAAKARSKARWEAIRAQEAAEAAVNDTDDQTTPTSQPEATVEGSADNE